MSAYIDRSRKRRVQRPSAAGNWMVGPPSSSSRDQEDLIWAGPVNGPLALRACVVPTLRPVLAAAQLEAGAVTGADRRRAVADFDSIPPAGTSRSMEENRRK